MKMCYVCRSPLDKLKNPYSHFCQTPHCDHSSCGKCQLYSNDAEDDAQAMRDAGIAAKEKYEAELQKEDGGKAGRAVKLDVDQIMHDPSQPGRQNISRRPQYQPRQQAIAVQQQRRGRPQAAMIVEQQVRFAQQFQQDFQRIQQRAQRAQLAQQHAQQQQWQQMQR